MPAGLRAGLEDRHARTIHPAEEVQVARLRTSERRAGAQTPEATFELDPIPRERRPSGNIEEEHALRGAPAVGRPIDEAAVTHEDPLGGRRSGRADARRGRACHHRAGRDPARDATPRHPSPGSTGSGPPELGAVRPRTELELRFELAAVGRSDLLRRPAARLDGFHLDHGRADGGELATAVPSGSLAGRRSEVATKPLATSSRAITYRSAFWTLPITWATPPGESASACSYRRRGRRGLKIGTGRDENPARLREARWFAHFAAVGPRRAEFPAEAFGGGSRLARATGAQERAERLRPVEDLGGTRWPSDRRPVVR